MPLLAVELSNMRFPKRYQLIAELGRVLEEDVLITQSMQQQETTSSVQIIGIDSTPGLVSSPDHSLKIKERVW